mmetsp:Transcript_86956/g.173966  ORF Transcript_86956/g.173966 Transcript_86956/m.173966 type:complete len:438 (+) Transcript_86956:104-1417(+)
MVEPHEPDVSNDGTEGGSDDNEEAPLLHYPPPLTLMHVASPFVSLMQTKSGKVFIVVAVVLACLLLPVAIIHPEESWQQWPMPEIRELSPFQLSELGRNMWVLKHAKQSFWQLGFSGTFKPYDEFVVDHWRDVQGLHCAEENLHNGVALFGIYHSLFVSEFETSLKSAGGRSKIGIAYWNWTQDLGISGSLTRGGGNLSEQGSAETFALSSTMFGSQPGSALNDGIFAGWQVSRVAKEPSLPPSRQTRPHNEEGFLRGSRVHGPELARFENYCGENIRFRDDEWKDCADALNFKSWTVCNVNLHNRLHRAIGGAIDCPSQAVEVAGVEETPLKKDGDFESAVSSVNDPVFFFLHAYFDRVLFAWAEKQSHLYLQVLKDPVEARAAVWRNLFDDIEKTMGPCRRHGAWSHHRYYKYLFTFSEFQDHFETRRRRYIGNI